MPLASLTAPRRDGSLLAKMLRIVCRAAHRPGSTAMPLTERMARDIGLGKSDLAALRHRWPSETLVHPRW